MKYGERLTAGCLSQFDVVQLWWCTTLQLVHHHTVVQFYNIKLYGCTTVRNTQCLDKTKNNNKNLPFVTVCMCIKKQSVATAVPFTASSSGDPARLTGQ